MVRSAPVYQNGPLPVHERGRPMRRDGAQPVGAGGRGVPLRGSLRGRGRATPGAAPRGATPSLAAGRRRVGDWGIGDAGWGEGRPSKPARMMGGENRHHPRRPLAPTSPPTPNHHPPSRPPRGGGRGGEVAGWREGARARREPRTVTPHLGRWPLGGAGLRRYGPPTGGGFPPLPEDQGHGGDP